MSKAWRYLIYTNSRGDWWKRMMTIIIAPIFAILYMLTLVTSSIMYFPILYFYWIINADTFSLEYMEFKIREFYFD